MKMLFKTFIPISILVSFCIGGFSSFAMGDDEKDSKSNVRSKTQHTLTSEKEDEKKNVGLSVPIKDPYSILLVEENGNSLGVYNGQTGEETGRVALNEWPHEIAITKDGKRGYVSNFGIRDYDAKTGFAGNSISIIDIPNCCEIDRLFTTFNGNEYWAPHGVKLSPDEQFLYVNVEQVKSRFPNPNTPMGLQETLMLIFDLKEKKVINSYNLHHSSDASPNEERESFDGIRFDRESFKREELSDPPKLSYSVLPGTHNFVFSKDGKQLWYYSGQNGITCINPDTGQEIKHLPVDGAVRGLSCNEDGTLLVSATNKLFIFNPKTMEIQQMIPDLGVGQLFYSQMTTDMKYILAPAAWEGQVVVVKLGNNNEKGYEIIKRISTGGIDPLQIKVPSKKILSQGKSAFITYATSSWISEISLDNFEEIRRIYTKNGANGIEFTNYLPKPEEEKFKIGVCLPFRGEYAVEGRECRLGLQYWQDTVNASGGIVFNNKKYRVEVAHADISDPSSLEQTVKDLLESNTDIRVMLGSYPSLTNLAVAKAANLRKIPFITSTGRERSLFEESGDYTFGISPIRKADLTGALKAIWRHFSPKPGTAIILSCDKTDSLDESRATANYAQQIGLQLLKPKVSNSQAWHIEEPGIVIFNHENHDLEDIIKRITKCCPDLFLVAGHRKESMDILRTCETQKFTPGALAFNGGIPFPDFRNRLGDLVNNVFNSVCWTDECSGFAYDRFVSSSDFQRKYFQALTYHASELTAGFAACGVVIEEMLRQAKDFSGEELREILSNFDLKTFYGPIRFNPSTKGKNNQKKMTTIQYRTIDNVMKEIPVWPLAIAKKEKPKWPALSWNK